MSKESIALRKVAEAYKKKADGITIDYGNTNLTYRRAQQLSANQNKANGLLKISSIAKNLCDAHENPDVTLLKLSKITTGPQIEYLLGSGGYPDTIQPDDPEWRQDMLKKKHRLVKSMGIENKDEFELIKQLFLPFTETIEQVGSSFSESAMLLKYPFLRDIPGFNPTPRKLGEKMYADADLEDYHAWMEPQAGFGSIADVICELSGNVNKQYIDVCEINTTLAGILREKGYGVISNDFATAIGPVEGYDRIFMNPPFERGQDVEFIRICFDKFLRKGGRLISIASPSWRFHRGKQYEAFRNWIGVESPDVEGKNYTSELQIEWETLPSGSFKSSFNPTGVETTYIIINKRP